MPEVSFQLEKKKVSEEGRKEEIQTVDKNQAPWPPLQLVKRWQWWEINAQGHKAASQHLLTLSLPG